MELESTPKRHLRHVRKAWAFWTMTSILLTLFLAAFYLLWGFRWPPTADVVLNSGAAVATVAATAAQSPPPA